MIEATNLGVPMPNIFGAKFRHPGDVLPMPIMFILVALAVFTALCHGMWKDGVQP